MNIAGYRFIPACLYVIGQFKNPVKTAEDLGVSMKREVLKLPSQITGEQNLFNWLIDSSKYLVIG